MQSIGFLSNGKLVDIFNQPVCSVLMPLSSSSLFSWCDILRVQEIQAEERQVQDEMLCFLGNGRDQARSSMSWIVRESQASLSFLFWQRSNLLVNRSNAAPTNEVVFLCCKPTVNISCRVVALKLAITVAASECYTPPPQKKKKTAHLLHQYRPPVKESCTGEIKKELMMKMVKLTSVSSSLDNTVCAKGKIARQALGRCWLETVHPAEWMAQSLQHDLGLDLMIWQTLQWHCMLVPARAIW